MRVNRSHKLVTGHDNSQIGHSLVLGDQMELWRRAAWLFSCGKLGTHREHRAAFLATRYSEVQLFAVSSKT